MKQVWPGQSQGKWIDDCKLQRDDMIEWKAIYLFIFIFPYEQTLLTQVSNGTLIIRGYS